MLKVNIQIIGVQRIFWEIYFHKRKEKLNAYNIWRSEF